MLWKSKSKFIKKNRRNCSVKKGEEFVENRYVKSKSQPIPITSSSGNWWLLTLPFLILGFFYFFTGVNIKTIEIPNTKYINRQDIVQLFEQQQQTSAWLVFKQSNLFLFSTRTLSADLEGRYFFNDLKISKNISNRSIVLEFDEKEYNIVWQETDTNFYINYQGEIILSQSLSMPLMDQALTIINESKAKRQGRAIAIDEKYLRFATALHESLNSKTKGLSNRQLAVNDDFNTIVVNMQNGPIIYFNTDMDIDEQINKLEALRRSDLSDGKVFNAQRYIDLRYGKTIYYQ